MSVEEKQARSVFVGNIPHGTTEDQMKEIFSIIGPVLSFRIVLDRETGNPKGYGFAEYAGRSVLIRTVFFKSQFFLDGDMAQSAIRNLNGFEFGGRTLRVDKASSQADELRLLHQQAPAAAPTFETVQSANITPDKVPEVIARTIGKIDIVINSPSNFRKSRFMFSQSTSRTSGRFNETDANHYQRISDRSTEYLDPKSSVDLCHAAIIGHHGSDDAEWSGEHVTQTAGDPGDQSDE